ncbi:hypothetical protein NCS56_01506600 [Fusarium sp. Ph1]|nr:hypothetical protein NCS56_01506600 [Fusarium sp. Ph1]
MGRNMLEATDEPARARGGPGIAGFVRGRAKRISRRQAENRTHSTTIRCHVVIWIESIMNPWPCSSPALRVADAHRGEGPLPSLVSLMRSSCCWYLRSAGPQVVHLADGTAVDLGHLRAEHAVERIVVLADVAAGYLPNNLHGQEAKLHAWRYRVDDGRHDEQHPRCARGPRQAALNALPDLRARAWNQGRWKEAEELEVGVIETTNSGAGSGSKPESVCRMLRSLARAPQSAIQPWWGRAGSRGSRKSI